MRFKVVLAVLMIKEQVVAMRKAGRVSYWWDLNVLVAAMFAFSAETRLGTLLRAGPLAKLHTKTNRGAR